MTTTTATSYAEAVRRALDDLDTATAADLLEGLEEHLAEVGVGDASTLESVLGPPNRYAAELRASAGLPPRAAHGAPATSAGVEAVAGPGTRSGIVIGTRALAIGGLAVLGAAALGALLFARSYAPPAHVVVIALAAGAALALTLALGRRAALPAPWDRGLRAVAVLAALAVAATLGAGHRRGGGQYLGPVSNDQVEATFPTVPYGPYGSVVVLPDLVGLPAKEAVDRLNGLGLVASGGHINAADDVVVTQDPPAGAAVGRGATVQLLVGSPGTAVPPRRTTLPATTTTAAAPVTTATVTAATTPVAPSTTSP